MVRTGIQKQKIYFLYKPNLKSTFVGCFETRTKVWYFMYRTVRLKFIHQIFNSDFKRTFIKIEQIQNFTISRAEILVEHRSGRDREKCGPDRVICLAPNQ